MFSRHPQIQAPSLALRLMRGMSPGNCSTCQNHLSKQKIIPSLQAEAKFYGHIITVFVGGPLLHLDSDFMRVLKFWVVGVGIDLAIV